MSKELFDEMKCEGWPCDGACETCPVKDDRRCVECRFFEADPASTWGNCKKNLYATRETDKACEDFERGDDD